jgi:hypothetical protein
MYMRAAYMSGAWADGAGPSSSSLQPVEFHILLRLAIAERHGYGIIQDIAARARPACLMPARCIEQWRK